MRPRQPFGTRCFVDDMRSHGPPRSVAALLHQRRRVSSTLADAGRPALLRAISTTACCLRRRIAVNAERAGLHPDHRTIRATIRASASATAARRSPPRRGPPPASPRNEQPVGLVARSARPRGSSARRPWPLLFRLGGVDGKVCHHPRQATRSPRGEGPHDLAEALRRPIL